MTRTRTIPRHVLAYLVSQPWLMHGPTLERVARTVLREPTLEPLDTAALGEPSAAVALRYGTPHETAQATVRDGIATISVAGPLMRYADFFTLMCGGCTYEQLSADLGTLLEDSSVRAIVLDIDSPGGEVNGCGELAELLHTSRGRKPIVACISGYGCSAAYWIAAACSEVVAAETAIVGSLGARVVYIDDRAAKQADGLTEIEIVSSQTPGKGHDDPTTPEGLAAAQRMTDSLAAVFLSAIATYRNRSIEALLQATYQGGTLVGAQAVGAGLVDRITTSEALHAELLARLNAPTSAPSPRGTTMKHTSGRPMAALYTAEQAVRALIARDVMIEEGAEGVVRAVVEGATVYAVEFPGGEYRWLAEDELGPVDAAATPDATDDEETPAPEALRRRAFETRVRAEERERVLGILDLPVTPEGQAVARQAVLDGVSVPEAAHRLMLAQPRLNHGRLQALADDDAKAPGIRAAQPSAGSPSSPDAIAKRITSAGKTSAPSQR